MLQKNQKYQYTLETLKITPQYLPNDVLVVLHQWHVKENDMTLKITKHITPEVAPVVMDGNGINSNGINIS